MFNEEKTMHSSVISSYSIKFRMQTLHDMLQKFRNKRPGDDSVLGTKFNIFFNV